MKYPFDSRFYARDFHTMSPERMLAGRWVLLLLLLGLMTSAARFTVAEDFPPVSELKPHDDLPDPLILLSGKKVASRQQWEAERRPELARLFQHYMYGFLPPKPVKTAAAVVTLDEKYLSGKALLEEVTISFLDPKLSHQLRVLVARPTQAGQPKGMFIGMNFCGNHAVVAHPQVKIPAGWIYNSCAGVEKERATEKGRGGQVDVWNLDLIIERGYGLATFYSGDLDPDTADFSDGIEPAFYKPGQTAPSADDAGAIATWAWGYHRVVDYLLEAKAAPPGKIIAVGHSRNGKTTLLAAALDERIAIAIPHQAGCGGTAPSRGKVGESVKQINDRFPHWFCEEFTKFNDHVNLLPFDQNGLVALCAPRPVLFSNALEDQWANPDGQFAVLRAASPVYEMLGVEGLTADARPEVGKLISSRLGYYLRAGKHSMTRDDWTAFLDFADKHLTNR